MLTEAGKLGAFATDVQFSPSNESSIAASLALPEAAALVLPNAAAGAATDGPSPVMGATPAPEAVLAGNVSTADAATGSDTNSLLAAGEQQGAAAEDELLLSAPSYDNTTWGSWGAIPGAGCEASILDVLNSTSIPLSITTALIHAAGLEGAFADEETPLTLFAPTNTAWLAAIKQVQAVQSIVDALHLRTVE